MLKGKIYNLKRQSKHQNQTHVAEILELSNLEFKITD